MADNGMADGTQAERRDAVVSVRNVSMDFGTGRLPWTGPPSIFCGAAS